MYTRLDIYAMILYSAKIRYHRHGDPDTSFEGYVYGDSYERWNGISSYHIKVKDPHAYAVYSVRPEDIDEVLDWHVAPGIASDTVTSMSRKLMGDIYHSGTALYGTSKEEELMKQMFEKGENAGNEGISCNS